MLGEVTPEAVIDLLAGRDGEQGREHDRSRAGAQERQLAALPGRRAALIAVAVIVAAFAIAGWCPAAPTIPTSGVIPFAEWIGAFMLWLKVNFTWADARRRRGLSTCR